MREGGGQGEFVQRVSGHVEPSGAGARDRRVTLTASRSGPLPTADEFGRYDAVLPGAAERLVAMAEKEQAFQHEVVRREQRAEHVSTFVGQGSGLLVALVFLVASYRLVVGGHAVPGTILGVTDIGLLVGLFLRRGDDAAARGG